MLGLLKNGRPWGWSAVGKHPAAKDFLSLGQDHALLAAFARTVNKAHRRVVGRTRSPGLLGSWDFWSAGAEGDFLVCGRVSGSTDSLGRPYPFLVLGYGIVRDWATDWDLLPLVLDRTWAGMAGLSRNSFESVKTLSDALAALPPPSGDLSDLAGIQRQVIEQAIRDFGSAEKDMRRQTMAFEARRDISLTIPGGLEHSGICYWHYMIKRYVASHPTPRAVFFGGGETDKELHLFKRPVGHGDLAGLWQRE